MGQTLTHGVYLPDEGERNCYNGLAANWSILDGAVGTIAEHTSALAGKAPLVHTHTKSDVTDLLNSDFIPSANNSYDLGSSSYQWNGIHANAYYSQSVSAELGVTGGTVPILFTDKNGKKLAGITFGNFVSSKLSYNRFSIYDKDSNNQELEEYLEFAFVANNQSCYFRPSATNKVNLGSSSYQWNNLYAKKVNTQSVNGVNPGALSLPNLIMQTYDPNNGWYNLDTTDWDLTGSPTDISSDVLKDGYLYICLACDSTGYVIICEGVFGYPNCFYSASGLPISGYARALLPVRRDTNVRLYLKGTSVYVARLFPALGNV